VKFRITIFQAYSQDMFTYMPGGEISAITPAIIAIWVHVNLMRLQAASDKKTVFSGELDTELYCSS
jgi:hypothetical protein